MESELTTPPHMFSRIKQAFATHSSIIFSLVFLIFSLSVVELSAHYFKKQAHDKTWQEAVSASKVIQETFALKFTDAFKSQALLGYLIEINGQVRPNELEAIMIGLYKDSRYIRNIAIAPHNQITYIYPHIGSEKALGLRYEKTPSQWPMVQHTIQEHIAHLAGPLQLVEGPSGLLYLVPVYLKDGSYWGMITTVIDTDNFLNFIQKDYPSLQVALRVNEEIGVTVNTGLFYGNENLLNADGVHVNIPIPGGSWEAIIRPNAINTTLLSSYQLLGLFLSILLSALLFITLNAVRERKNNNEKSSKIASQLPGMVFQFCLRADGSSYFPYVSEAIRDIYRLSPEEVSKDASKIFALLHPDDYDDINVSIQNSAQDLRPWHCEYRIKFEDGTVRWLLGDALLQNEADGSTLWHGFITDITERKLLEQNLAKNKQLLKSIIDSTPSHFFAFDLDHRFIMLNNEVMKFYGLPKEEILGKTLHDVFQKDIADNLMITNAHIIASGDIETKEETIISKKFGESRTVITSKFPIWDTDGNINGLGGVSTDITERKQAENKLRLSNVALRTINQGVLITDIQQNIIWTNKAYQLLSGYNDSELIGQNSRLFHGPLTDRETLNSIRLALKERRLFNGEILNYRKDGSSFWKELTILPIFDDEGQLTNFMSISRDMTEQKLAESSLKHGMREAEHANTVKSQFLAIMSHEIRTPLNAILGMQELLTHTPLDNTQTEYLQTATLAGNNLLALVNDILDLTKVEAGKLDLEDLAFDVIELTQLCVKLLTVTAEAKALKLITIIDPELTPWISGDPLRFRQVLLNLLSNAIKFTEQGSVTVTLSSYVSTDSACALLVEVIDTGIGIPENLQAGLFEVFVQVDPSDTRKYGGSGLGLAISKRLVTLWGGQIGIDSTPYVGSRFWFTVGALAEAPIQPLFPAIEQDDSNKPNTCIARVLLVEDSLLNQAVTAAMLRKGGHQVDLADCGAQGIEAASEKVYDIILMDVSMPDMSGMEATAIIRQLGGAATSVPIIAITAHALAGYEAMCLAAGMNGYATKPISQKDLLALVEIWSTNKDTQTTAVISPLVVNSSALPIDEQETNIDKAMLDELTATLGQAQVKELLQIYLTELTTRCETIKKAIISQDLSILSREGHTIKSSSATFGATALQAVGKELEACGYNDDLATALLVADRLLPCAEATMKMMALSC